MGNMNNFGLVLADTRYSIRTGLEYKDFYRVFCNVVIQCRLARELVPAIEARLIRDEALLISKLRGSYGQERFFRFTKHHLGLWSTRVDLLDDIPDIISSIWQSCLTIMECLDYIERYSRILLARFQDKGWVSRHQGLPELRWCLEYVDDSVSRTLSGLRMMESSWTDYLPLWVTSYPVRLLNFISFTQAENLGNASHRNVLW
ncbi:hypothetical protein EDD85DRAFT_92613 [Armillaria nabsnona]|nr:hypothetical protein EDD85DRAFT_92613 [Armillaria nabsnona]